MKKRNLMIILIVLIIMIVIIGVLLYINSIPKESPPVIIGGNKDSHGCLGPAGYSWNETVGACLREWELNSDQRKAAKIALAPLSYHVTIVNVYKTDCPGCYSINLQRNDNQDMLTIQLSNWSIVSPKTYCTEEQKKAQVCPEYYSATCGWFNSSIKCIKYPCAETFANPCVACADSKVEYYTSGECPK